MPWMKVDLHKIPDGSGINQIGIPGILYDEDNAVIDTADKLAHLYMYDYLGLPVENIKWYNPCTQATESYSLMPWGWSGDNFNIYPGQAIEIVVSNDCTLPLKFGQGYKKHLICTTDSTDYYCEWFGQEEFDPLEG